MKLCGRIMIGSGGDTWDPICELVDGHRPHTCKSTAATDQNRLSLVGRIYRCTDRRGGPQRILVTHDHPDSGRVLVENESCPFRPRAIERARLLNPRLYEHVGWTPSSTEPR